MQLTSAPIDRRRDRSEYAMRLASTALLLLVANGVFAQPVPVDDRFYQAIRQDNLTLLRALIRAKGINANDAQGQTPLMLAAAFGSPEAVRLLIASGAEVSAASHAGATALHWAATDLTKTRLLLEAHADVNAVSQIGRTPLIVAASANGTAAIVSLMLAKGAAVNAADATGITPLVAAANVDNLEAARVLLAHGADVRATARTGLPATPLMGAAVNGNTELVRTLLTRKADIAVVSADRVGVVKNGPVQLGKLTALHAAITGGNADVVERLLQAGAAVDAADVRGMTPLMWAVATDRPQSRIIRMLLASGAKPGVRSLVGDAATDWARRFNNPVVLAEFGMTPVVPGLAPARDTASPPISAREAVRRSLTLLRTGSARTMTDGGCVACHAQPMTALAIEAAHARGWTAPSADAEVAQSVLMTAAGLQTLQLREVGGQPDAPLYVTTMMAARRMPSSPGTDALVHLLAAKQRREGNWVGVGATRAPMQDGDFSRTALAIRALTVYATPARRPEYDLRVARAAAWLSAQRPLTTEDHVMQLLGLYWAKSGAAVRRHRIKELLALQRGDGGWAQTPHLAGDAYATGQALYTLRELGLPATNASLQRGAMFLLRTQRDDGAWHVKSRAMKIQPYFESGFPYEHDQWISQAGTAWATIGLTMTALEN